MTTEVYYLDKNEQALSTSQIDYVQLNSGTPYDGYSDLQQANLFEESSGNKAGKFYVTRFFQTDSSDNTVNVQGTTTLSLQNGIIVFTSNRNYLKLKAGDKTFYKPIYQSGVYLKKNVEIIREIIQVPSGLLNKYIINY